MMPHDLFENVKVLAMGCAVSATAGGAGDNTELVGEILDRQGYESCMIAVPYKAALGTAESLSLALTVEESLDGVTFDAAAVLLASTAVATQAAAGTCQDVYFLKVNLSGVGAPRKRYLRFNLTPNLSRANTDTAILSALVILGGAQNKATPAWALATA